MFSSSGSALRLAFAVRSGRALYTKITSIAGLRVSGLFSPLLLNTLTNALLAYVGYLSCFERSLKLQNWKVGQLLQAEKHRILAWCRMQVAPLKGTPSVRL
jgi:hypothetical protein